MSGLTTHGFPRELSLTALRRRLSIDVANAPAVPLGAAQRRILQLQRELRARPKRADDAQRRRAELEARVAAADRTHQATLDGVNLAFTSEIDAVRAVQAAELRRAQAAAKADLAGLVSELAAATLTAERVAADAAAARAELVEEHARAKQHFANELGVAAAQKDGLTSTVQAAARKHVAAEGLVARLRDEIVATQSAATQSAAAAAAEQRAIAAQGDVLRRCTSDAMSAVAEAALLLRNQLAHEGVVVGGNDEDAPAPDAVVELTVVELAAAAMPQLEPQPELLFTATTGDAADGDGDDAIQRRIVESATFLTGGVSVSGGDELHSHSHSQSHSQPQLPGDEAASVRVQLQATNVVEVEDDARLVQQVEAKVYLLKGRVEQFLSHHVAGRTQLALSLDEAQGKVTAERSATAAAETFALAAREEALKAQLLGETLREAADAASSAAEEDRAALMAARSTIELMSEQAKSLELQERFAAQQCVAVSKKASATKKALTEQLKNATSEVEQARAHWMTRVQRIQSLSKRADTQAQRERKRLVTRAAELEEAIAQQYDPQRFYTELSTVERQLVRAKKVKAEQDELMVAARTHVAAQQAQIMRLETMAEKREDAAAQQKADADASIAQLRMLRTHDEKRAKRDAAALRKALKIQEDECTAMLKAQHFEKGQRGRAAKERARLARARDRALSEANTARAELKRASTKHADADGARWALESRATALQLELDAVLRAQADAAEAHRVEIDAHAKQLDELQEREKRAQAKAYAHKAKHAQLAQMMTRRRPPAPGDGLIQAGAAPRLGAQTWAGAPIISHVGPQTPVSVPSRATGRVSSRVVDRLHSAIEAGASPGFER